MSGVVKPRTSKRRGGPSGTPGTHANKGVVIRLPDDERRACDRAAEASGQTRSDWIRSVLRRAAALVR